jgi:hypothetical protein
MVDNVFSTASNRYYQYRATGLLCAFVGQIWAIGLWSAVIPVSLRGLALSGFTRCLFISVPLWNGTVAAQGRCNLLTFPVKEQ